MKIAMWSGPRNLSTAMMYSFAQREDSTVWDEPFYAAYLAHSGLDHPMRKEVLYRHETDPEKVALKLAGRVPNGAEHWYQKHMAFHMLDGFPMKWAEECIHVHLLRHPALVIASYASKREQPTLDDIGFRQQVEIFQRFPGPVIDTTDFKRNPEKGLRALCNAISLPFDPAMLFWTAGPKEYDGVWAAHWYGSVHGSIGFSTEKADLPELTGHAADLLNKALPYYLELEHHKFCLQ